MLTHYMQPQDILPEFWQDLKRSTYWMTKQSGGDKGRIMALKEITYFLHQPTTSIARKPYSTILQRLGIIG